MKKLNDQDVSLDEVSESENTEANDETPDSDTSNT